VDNEIGKLILSLATAFDEQASAENSDTIKQLHESFNANEELYESQINLAAMYFQDFVARPYIEKYGVLDTKNKSIIGMIYTNTFTHFVRKIIERNEGSACSGDKESFIVSKVMKAISTGENQSLYANYEGCDRIAKDDWGKQAYWSPKSFKDTNDVIDRFWKWYRVE